MELHRVTTMLILFETYNQRKEFLLDYIKTCRELVRLVNDLIKKYHTLYSEGIFFINNQHSEIKQTMTELVELKKWFNKQNLRPDEPYIPPRYKK